MSDLKWQDRGKKTAPYVWTAKDEAFEHGRETAGVSDPRVTPYRIKPGKLSGAGQYTAGQVVTVPLDMIPQIGEPWTINRFYPAGEFDWEKLEGDEAEKTKDCKTIGELCQKLFSINPRKYVELYYNFEKLDKEARHNVAAMLFEYWDNAQLRYDVTKQGFDWEVMSRDRLGAPSIPAVKGESRLLYVMVRKPSPEKRAVAPGAQTLVASPDIFKLLDLHVGELNQKVARAQALLDQSEQYMRDRARLAQRVTALRVLLQTSASAKTEQPAKATALVDHARAVEQKIDKPSRTAALSELFAMDKGPHAPSLVKVIRKELGLVDDIAAALKGTRDEIAGMLFDDDTLFAKHVEAFATWAKERKQEQSQPVQVAYSKLAHAMAGALDILNETDMGDAHHAKVERLIESFPDNPLTGATKSLRSAAEKIAAFLGKERADTVWPYAKAAMSNAANMVGNLAGPPSLYIAVVQVKAWRELRSLIADKQLKSDAATKSYLDRTIALLDKGAKMPPELKAKFSGALKARDIKALDRIKREVLDEFSGTYQSTKGWKVGGLLLQVISVVIACGEVYSKKKAGEEVGPIEVISILSPGASVVVGVGDLLNDIFTAEARFLQPLGMGVGLVTSFVGVLTCGYAAAEAARQGDKLGVIASGAGVAGNFLLYTACVAWFVGAPVPGLNVAASVLLAAASVLTAYHDESEKQKTATSRVARSLVDQIRLNPFYSLFAKAESGEAEQVSKTSVDWLLSAIEDACKEGWLKLPPNNNFVLNALYEAGFDRETITTVVDPSGAPFSPGVKMSG